MVDALASDRSDQPFGEAVLPRRAWGDGLVADAHGAQSRLFDLNGETDRVRTRKKSAIIAVDVRRFGHAINTDEVFGTHTSPAQQHQFGLLNPTTRAGC